MGPLFGWLQTLTMAFQGLGGGPPLPLPSLTRYSVPLAPTLPPARHHAPRSPLWATAPGTLTSMDSSGERAPGVTLPISGWWGLLLGPPQSSLVCFGFR